MTIEDLERQHAAKQREQAEGSKRLEGSTVGSLPDKCCFKCIYWGEAWEFGQNRTCITRKNKTHQMYLCDKFNLSKGVTALTEVKPETSWYDNFID